MIQGVIFDMDGLMFDTERLWDTFWQPACAELGVPMPADTDTFLAGGRGLAGKMFAFVAESARAEGLSAVYLNVNRGNTGVIRVYEHLGFQIVREEKNDIGGGFFMDDYVMECPLT